jgi:hypothetical protein
MITVAKNSGHYNVENFSSPVKYRKFPINPEPICKAGFLIISNNHLIILTALSMLNFKDCENVTSVTSISYITLHI